MKRVLLVFAALLPAACASSDQQSASNRTDCFNVRAVSSFSTVGRGTVRVSAGPRRNFDLAISGASCSQVNWAQGIAIDARPSSWICASDRLAGRIAFRDTGTGQRVSCFIDSVTRVEVPQPAP